MLASAIINDLRIVNGAICRYLILYISSALIKLSVRYQFYEVIILPKKRVLASGGVYLVQCPFHGAELWV